jgi:hypothetical protein
MSQTTQGCQDTAFTPSTPSSQQPQTDFQRLIVEQALALAQHLERAALSAPKGQILNRCEAVILSSGRDFLRHILSGSLQQQIDDLEKKGVRPVPVPVDTPQGTKAKTLATS